MSVPDFAYGHGLFCVTDLRERKRRERETDIDWLMRAWMRLWVIPVCALSRDRTCHLGLATNQ